MADYIYLMQNRLTPAQWRALEAVREAARAQGMPVFLVGGAVRDLASGAPVRDLDFAVQGDAKALVSDLQARGAVLAGEHPVLQSVFLTFRGGVRVEIGPTLSVSYPKPGKQEAKPAAILEDLRRRDFTANAMAVSLNEGSYGLLLDPLNGTADIENRELRIVSPYGFIEQPALLLRAARLSSRLGWSLEARTQSRYETSKEDEHIKALPAWHRGYELEEIFHEEDPLLLFEQMEAEGWRDVLFPILDLRQADRDGMDAVRDLIGQMESQRLYPDPSAVYFPLLTAKATEDSRAALKAAFPRQGFATQIDTMEARSKELANQLGQKNAPLPSDAWKVLMDADPEVLLFLAFHTRSGAVQTRIKAFLKDWPQMRSRIPYALMQEMRITPDLPIYEQLLDDVFFALIDGKLETPEAIRAFLEPFSPPAPAQVSVRRRPVKSARGRGKRAAEAVVDEPEETPEESGADEPEPEPETPRPEFGLPSPISLDLIEDEPETEKPETEERETTGKREQAMEAVAPAIAAEADAADATLEVPAPLDQLPAPSPAQAAKEKPAGKAKPAPAPAKRKPVAEPAAKAAPAVNSKASASSAAAKGGGAKVTVVPASKPSAAKSTAAKAKARGGPTGKVSSEPPVKVATKAASGGKAAAKKLAAKAPEKVAKALPKKAALVPVAAKKAAPKGAAKSQTPAKRPATPAKAAVAATGTKAGKKAVKARGR